MTDSCRPAVHRAEGSRSAGRDLGRRTDRSSSWPAVEDEAESVLAAAPGRLTNGRTARGARRRPPASSARTYPPRNGREHAEGRPWCCRASVVEGLMFCGRQTVIRGHRRSASLEPASPPSAPKPGALTFLHQTSGSTPEPFTEFWPMAPSCNSTDCPGRNRARPTPIRPQTAARVGCTTSDVHTVHSRTPSEGSEPSDRNPRADPACRRRGVGQRRSCRQREDVPPRCPTRLAERRCCCPNCSSSPAGWASAPAKKKKSDLVAAIQAARSSSGDEPPIRPPRPVPRTHPPHPARKSVQCPHSDFQCLQRLPGPAPTDAAAPATEAATAEPGRRAPRRPLLGAASTDTSVAPDARRRRPSELRDEQAATVRTTRR